ncbi:RodZ domain-containing protein [Pseudoalteromonas luteoviolacea]|uniref:HTH cro/C1-type domain-containing protein n=1 Tax=Pseudoalteromonas luteoviolacea NCIMB 1942 TaxID=1365253 RepID=A0A166Y4E9_9GAMM|nr:RodZ domain-containing protein [Pseudoalteromonas luteoviolacea]KZN41435.1 hypothetical protein N482_03800 [Pseudoalteromonas luteoviolacea NCIMB 1942]KZX01097.1 hypothetical protein JL49_07555 [Pseudoalteromonas luteoviolacea]
MNQEEIETTTETVSLGETLANARAQQNLSLEDVAARLKLNHTQITKLEQDAYHSLGPETFVRGYIKSYSALLGLESEHILALYETPNVPEQKRNMKSFSRRTEKEANDSRLMIVSYIVVIAFIGLSALWWWQTASTSDTIEEANFIPEATNSTSPSTPKVLEPREQPGRPQVEVKAETPEAVHSPTADPVKVDSAPSGESADTQAQPPVTIDTEVASQTVSPTASEEAATSEVVMHFEDDSWVEIFDATQERIAFGVKKAGYTMTVNGISPFFVVLGKHQVVSIELDGQPVDISGLPRNRLAKFNLPLAE